MDEIEKEVSALCARGFYFNFIPWCVIRLNGEICMFDVVETMGKKVRREKGTNAIMQEEIG